jgi:hypothetical protein
MSDRIGRSRERYHATSHRMANIPGAVESRVADVDQMEVTIVGSEPLVEALFASAHVENGKLHISGPGIATSRGGVTNVVSGGSVSGELVQAGTIAGGVHLGAAGSRRVGSEAATSHGEVEIFVVTPMHPASRVRDSNGRA